MTQGDYLELSVIATLYGLAFTTNPPRWRLFWALHVMAFNMLAGRVFILNYTDAYILCGLLQALFAAIFIFTSETVKGVILGLLYASMVVGAGLTGLGYLSHETSVGLALNYWSVMSIATYLQFVVVLFHVITQWQKYGLAGRNRLGRG